MATGPLKVLRSCDTHDSAVLNPALQAWQGSGLLLLLLLFQPFCFSGLRAGSGTGLAVHIHWTVLFVLVGAAVNLRNLSACCCSQVRHAERYVLFSLASAVTTGTFQSVCTIFSVYIYVG